MSEACGANCGITRTRARDLERARDVARRAHPSLIWSELQTEQTTIHREELLQLAEALRAVVPGRVLYLEGENTEAESLLLLLHDRTPSALELLRGDGADPCVAHPEVPALQTSVRVLFSPLGRFYTLQEVHSTVSRDENGTAVSVSYLNGLHDRRLQWIVKAVQGLLRRERWISLDAAFLSQPASENADASLWWALLFEPYGPARESTMWLPDETRQSA